MSLINGDKSRAHRERKQNIQRRLRTQTLLQAEAAKSKPVGARKKAKSAGHPRARRSINRERHRADGASDGGNPQNHPWRWVWLVEVVQALTNGKKSVRGRTSNVKNWKRNSSASWKNNRVSPAKTTISDRMISVWLETTKSPKK